MIQESARKLTKSITAPWAREISKEKKFDNHFGLVYNVTSVDNDMVAKIERILKALGDKNRLRIVNMVAEKPLCVCEITEVLKLSQSTVSGHLRVLKDAGILCDRKDGLWVEYSLARDEKVSAALVDLITDALKDDPGMREERKQAVAANRDVICKGSSSPS